jgi:bacteriocin biosynthesis cyclodehydratase domain-containing protein
MKAMRIRIKRQYSIVAHSADLVELRFGVWNPRSYTLRDDSASGRLARLVLRLRFLATPRELARDAKAPQRDADALVDHLTELGVLESSAENALDHYLDELAPMLGASRDGDGKAADLSAEAVVLLGDGSLTAQVCRHLRASLPGLPVSEVDGDHPEARALARPDPDLFTNTLELQRFAAAFASWAGSFVIVLQRVVDPLQLRALNRVALEHRLTWMHAAIDGPFLLVGPLFVPYRTACYECFETRVLMNLREAASYQQYKNALAAGSVQRGAPPPLPAVDGLLSAYTALDGVNYLLTGAAFTAGKVHGVYLPTMEHSFNDVLRFPSCPACSPVAERDDQELYFDMRALLAGP